MRYARTHYEGPIDFWIGELLLTPRRFLAWDHYSQWRYNRSTPFLQDRLDLLRKLVEVRKRASAESKLFLFDEDAMDEFSLFEAIYSTRAFGHPNANQEIAQFQFLLESLKESEDLEDVSGNYRLSGKSVKTLAEYEEQERRHADSVQHNRRLFWLTLVIALAAVAQLFV